MKLPKISIKNIFSKFKKSNKLKKEMDEIEKEFNKGNIILPTGFVDYQNFEDFKNKTSHLTEIQDQLKVIEKNKPERIVEENVE